MHAPLRFPSGFVVFNPWSKYKTFSMCCRQNTTYNPYNELSETQIRRCRLTRNYELQNSKRVLNTRVWHAFVILHTAGRCFGRFQTFSASHARRRYVAIGIRRIFEANALSMFANYNYGFITCLLRGRVLVCNKLQATKTIMHGNDTPPKLHSYTRARFSCDCCCPRAYLLLDTNIGPLSNASIL